MTERTIPNLFLNSVKKFPKNVLMWEKEKYNYVGTTYAEMKTDAFKFAGGLLSLGVKKNDRVALIAEGRNYWLMAELGILLIGGVNVPISVKIDEVNDLKFRLEHSGSKVLIISVSQVGKIRQIKNDLPALEKIIIMDPRSFYEEDEIFFGDVLQRGKDYLDKNEKCIEKRIADINENDYATITYTSGTTADPKGVILTHRNYTANVEQASALLPVPQNYCSLLILPWDHCFAHTAGIYTLMKNGASMASVQSGSSPLETLRNIPKNIKETRPTFLLSVPALAKNFRKNIERGIREKGPAVENMFNKALELAYNYNQEGWNKGKGLRKFKKPLLMFYDKILFKKIREQFGGRLKFFIGGGALLDIELQRFFYAIGIPMLQGYGLSEAAPVISSNVPAKHKLGSSGAIVEGLEVNICDEEGKPLPVGEKGEIVVKGENVMAGYWRNDMATEDTIRDGWLYTGDLGYLDKDNFLYVLGRFKSLLIGNDGEKFSPEGIEETITETSKYIDQMMLYNNQSPYTVGLVVPNKDALMRWSKEKGLSIKTEEGQKAILKKIENEINQYRSGGEFAGMFPERWLPSSVAILGEAFTERNRFLNSTMKMVRGKIEEYYRARIDYLYTADAKNICNPHNMNIVSKFDY